MNMAKALMELRKLKKKIKEIFKSEFIDMSDTIDMSEPIKKIKDIAQKEDPFGYGELTDASLIESRRAVIAENESIRAQLKKNHRPARKKYWAENFRHFNEQVVLDDKVDEFIDWFTETMVKKRYYTDIGEYSIPINMRNFIEKMAVWYELRYPDYEINRIMPGSSQEQTEINKVMFANNQYTNDILDEDSEIKDLDWDEFYNTKAFINSLPWSERDLFSRPKYQNIVYWNRKHSSAHLHLTSNGFVEMSEYMDCVIPEISNKDLEGKNIKEIVNILKERGVKFPDNNEFEKAIEDYDNRVYQKEEMLNCVMYRIIERGENRFGPRRAFLFAKEFGRNIDIPMAYGVDTSDSGLRLFINDYIKAGGSRNLVCNIGYGLRASKYEKLSTITIQELIRTESNNYAIFNTPDNTPEKNELYQILVNVLSNRISQDNLSEAQKKLRKSRVIEQRLQRKLEKSKQTGK